MATYAELYDIKNDASLLNKIAVSVIKKAQTILELATPTANQLAWASNALTNPESKARVLLSYVIAANSSATPSQIQTATDAAVQANVNTAVDKLIAGGIV